MNVVITGGGGGIGAEVARRRAIRGDSILLIDRDIAALNLLIESLDCRSRVTCLALDLGESDFDHRLAHALSSPGLPRKIDAVVHCAGIGGWNSLADIQVDEWNKIINVNARAPVFVTQALLPQLRRPGASVIFLSSDSALHAFANRASYCASKAALSSFAGVLRREIGSSGVRVSTVYFNRVDTQFNGGVPGSRPEALQPADIASVIDQLIDLRLGTEIREITLASMNTPFGY